MEKKKEKRGREGRKKRKKEAERQLKREIGGRDRSNGRVKTHTDTKKLQR